MRTRHQVHPFGSSRQTKGAILAEREQRSSCAVGNAGRVHSVPQVDGRGDIACAGQSYQSVAATVACRSASPAAVRFFAVLRSALTWPDDPLCLDYRCPAPPTNMRTADRQAHPGHTRPSQREYRRFCAVDRPREALGARNPEMAQRRRRPAQAPLLLGRRDEARRPSRNAAHCPGRPLHSQLQAQAPECLHSDSAVRYRRVIAVDVTCHPRLTRSSGDSL